MSKASFQPGQTVWLETAGRECEIREFLSSGSQGEVYHCSFNNRDCILKWYFPRHATAERRAMLSRVIRKEPPSESFIWPVDLALHQGHPSFGYITPSRDVRFRSFGELLSRRVDPTFHALTTAGLCLADAFMRLHIAGFCHSRISLQNLFLDPHTGEISLSENDDLVPDGEPWHGGIGAPRFLAPELIRGKTGPSVATDHHTLAVLLFLMLMVHHPLEGRQESEIHCFDLEARRKVYGSQPLFIFDAKNLSNRPVPGLQDNALLFWNFYPAYVRDIFHRAFTDGLRDPQSRVGENEWRSLFIRDARPDLLLRLVRRRKFSLRRRQFPRAAARAGLLGLPPAAPGAPADTARASRRHPQPGHGALLASPRRRPASRFLRRSWPRCRRIRPAPTSGA